MLPRRPTRLAGPFGDVEMDELASRDFLILPAVELDNAIARMAGPDEIGKGLAVGRDLDTAADLVAVFVAF